MSQKTLLNKSHKNTVIQKSHKSTNLPLILHYRRQFLKALPVVLTLLGIMTFSFALRTINQWHLIFVNGQVWFRGVDSDYHMRLADAMIFNFPNYLHQDMYAAYPSGSLIGFFPMLSWIIVATAKLTGINYEVIGALLPPVMGTLVVIPIFFLGKSLFNAKIGILAALLTILFPGELFHRTLLGFTDHHALEIVLMPTLILLFYLAHKRHSWWFTIAAGLTAGIFNMSWQASSFIMLIIGIWFWLDFLISIKNNKPDYWICTMIPVAVVISLIISLPVVLGGTTAKETVAISGVMIIAPLALATTYKLIKNKEIFLFMLTLAIPLSLAGVDAVLSTISPSANYNWFTVLGQIFWGFGTTIQEVSPADPKLLLDTFGIAPFLALGGLYFAFRKKVSPLFLVYSLAMILAMMGQRRWSYYAAIPIGILTAYCTFEVTRFIKENTRATVVAIIIIFSVFSIAKGTIQLTALPNNISPDWHQAMDWLKNNSPDPFAKYNETHKLPAYDTINLSVKPDYGVLSWWDYGNWITRNAQRVPVDSPVHANIISTKYLMAQTEEEAEQVLAEVKYNIKYVILDTDTVTNKWYAVAERAGYGFDTQRKMWPNSQAARLWNGTSKFYKLVYNQGTVRIWERVQ